MLEYVVVREEELAGWDYIVYVVEGYDEIYVIFEESRSTSFVTRRHARGENSTVIALSFSSNIIGRQIRSHYQRSDLLICPSTVISYNTLST
jgi:hypothetical protein